MTPIDTIVFRASNNLCNVEVFTDGSTDPSYVQFGVRLRPWDRHNKGKMVIGGGQTVEEAFISAARKAQEGRWEPLDFAKRPWAVAGTQPGWE